MVFKAQNAQVLLLPILLMLVATGSSKAEGCTAGMQAADLVGVVRDTSGALIPRANVTLGGRKSVALQTDAGGSYSASCLPAGKYVVSVKANGFQGQTRAVSLTETARPAKADFQLLLAAVVTTVDAVNDPTSVDTDHGAGTLVLGQKDLARLSNDPDELLKQLQAMSATTGGAPSQSILTVDGFVGESRLPSKSSIASIRINPDLFAAQYDRPPYLGGRIEVTTKPGEEHFHGALLAVEGSHLFNAQDPLASSKPNSSTQIYAANIDGPLVKRRADMSLSLETRRIDQFSIVSATGVDQSGTAKAISENVFTPQRLWLGSARVDTQIGKEIVALSYSTSRNQLANQGVGGLVLAEAGSDSGVNEDDLRLTTFRAYKSNSFDEFHVSVSSIRTRNTPVSTAPRIEVAGAFIGGGSPLGALHRQETGVEADYDYSLTKGRHTLRVGIQSLGDVVHESDPNGFNGDYLFAGTETVAALTQYSNAVHGIAGAAPSNYTVTTGVAGLNLAPWRVALFVQDEWKLSAHLSLSPGLRYALQTAPGTYNAITPRIGLAWAPGSRQSWTFRAHVGLFADPISNTVLLDAQRLAPTHAVQQLFYSPMYGQPVARFGPHIDAYRQLGSAARTLPESPSMQSHVGVEHALPRHWDLMANVYYAVGWRALRSVNVNAPLPGADGSYSPYGRRPLAGNPDNVFEYQASGNSHATVVFAGVNQYSLKHLQIFAGYVYIHVRTNADDPTTFPQSTYSNLGEQAQPSLLASHRFMSMGGYKLPWGLNFSEVLEVSSGRPINLTTGADNNADGTFNNRPSFAIAGQTGAIETPFGPLTSLTQNGSVPRNFGRLPWTVGVDASLARTFALPHAGDQGITAAVRSTNVLNKANVTGEGGVLGSPSFLRPYSADYGRRILLELRYSF